MLGIVRTIVCDSSQPLQHGWKCTMAQQTTVQVHRRPRRLGGVGHLDFSLEGRNYQIDLSDENAAKLRDALAPYIDALARPADAAAGGRDPAADCDGREAGSL